MSVKLDRLLHLYEDELLVRHAPRTAPHYLAQLGFFLRWLDDHQVALNEVRAEDLQRYQSELYAQRSREGKPLSVSTQHARLSALKSFFRFLYRRGYLVSDPAASIELPRTEKRLPRTILTETEVQKILAAAARAKTPRGLRDRAILEVFYATGIRVTELANLTPYDVDPDEGTLRVVLGKGRKDRGVPLTRAAVLALEAYLDRGRRQLVGSKKATYLFLSDHGGFLHRAVLNRLVRHYAQKARVGKHITCHTFRHSVATHLLRGRADIRYIQALLGHRSLSTTERYTRVELSDLKEVIARAHPRGR